MLHYLKKYWHYCLLAPLFMLGEITMDLLQPDMMKTIVDEGVLKSDMSVIFTMGRRMVLLVAFGGTCGVLCGVFANIAAQKFGNDVRKDLFARIMDLSFQQIDKLSTGSLVTRITNDVTQVQNMVMMSVRSLVRCTVIFAGGIYMLYRQLPRFALVAGCGLPFVAFFVIWFLKKASPLFVIVQQKIDRINCMMQENIAGARVVKAYVKESYELERFAEANGELCGINLRVQTLLAFMNPCVNIVLNLCVAGVLYVGGVTVQRSGDVTPGQTMAAITYLTLILMRIIFMANIFQTFTRAGASWQRIKEVLELEPAHRDGRLLPDEGKKGEVVFENVTFAYPDAPENCVLKNVSLQIKQGETVALIGATGSGKSTLAHLIPRFYDVTQGAVFVDGIDVRDYPIAALRDKIGIVLQKTELFSRSIAENIRWGREDASWEEIQRAAQTAQASEFIERTKDNYDTNVTEGGHSLSGGQKQRLSIARAVLKNPEILIFDDSGSALDLRTEAKLHKALGKDFAGATKIIIAQRIASVKDADRIFVLDNGSVCAAGSHEELLETSKIYREICGSQLTKEMVQSAG